MATNVDMGGDTLYVSDVFINNTTPGSQSGISVASVLGSTSEKLVVTSTSANSLAVGPNGSTTPIFNVDSSTASAVAGLNVKGAATGGTVAISTTDSGSATNLTINAKGTGTIGIGSVSTGAVTITPALSANGGITTAAGTASVAPITLTAGTNLTAAAAGAVEFDGTAFYATAVASSRQQLDAEQLIIATANSATYNNTGLDTASAAPVFTATTNPSITNGAITLAAGKTYCFEFLYNLTNTGTTSHTWATVLAGTATFSAGSNYQVYGNSFTTASTPATGGLAGFISSTTLSTAVVCTAASTSATEQVAIQGFGTLVINAGGTVIPQLKASARPGATGTPGVVLLAGSFFRIWEMGSGVVGNWS